MGITKVLGLIIVGEEKKGKMETGNFFRNSKGRDIPRDLHSESKITQFHQLIKVGSMFHIRSAIFDSLYD